MIRLAAECGQLHDVDGFISQLSPEKFAELWAFDQVEPIGNEKICTTIANGFAQLFTMLGSMHRDDDSEPPEPYDADLLTPWRMNSSKKPPEPQPQRMLTPNEAAAKFALMAKAYGKPG